MNIDVNIIIDNLTQVIAQQAREIAILNAKIQMLEIEKQNNEEITD